MEQYELKHAEFARCIRAFRYYEQAWMAMSAGGKGGRMAYARRVADMWSGLAAEAEHGYKTVGRAEFVQLGSKRLADVVASWREQELAWMKDWVSLCSVSYAVADLLLPEH
jgi:hypothetical protein